MLGEFVDDFTVRVVDVFAMPQSGTGVSVEAVDPVFQMKMMDMLRQTGRYVERASGAHPAFGPMDGAQANLPFPPDPRPSSAGTIPIQVSAAGSLRLILTPNKVSSS